MADMSKIFTPAMMALALEAMQAEATASDNKDDDLPQTVKSSPKLGNLMGVPFSVWLQTLDGSVMTKDMFSKIINANTEEYNKVIDLNLSRNSIGGQVFDLLPEKIQSLKIERMPNISGYFCKLFRYKQLGFLSVAATYLINQDLEEIKMIPSLKKIDISACRQLNCNLDTTILFKNNNLTILEDRRLSDIDDWKAGL